MGWEEPIVGVRGQVCNWRQLDGNGLTGPESSKNYVRVGDTNSTESAPCGQMLECWRWVSTGVPMLYVKFKELDWECRTTPESSEKRVRLRDTNSTESAPCDQMLECWRWVSTGAPMLYVKFKELE